MNADRLLALYEKVAEAPGAVSRLRRFVLDLAVRGKLVPQDPGDEPIADHLRRIEAASEITRECPANWGCVPLGKILDFKYGKGMKASERLEEGPVPVFGSNGIVGYTTTPLTDKPAIIIGRKGSAGALNLCESPSWTTDVAYFVEAPSFLDLQYLFLALQTLELDSLGKGVKPGLSRADAYPLAYPLPPLAEQRRIVAKVEELMALLDRLEAARTAREATRDRLTAASLTRLTAPDTEASSGKVGTGFPSDDATNKNPADFPANARFALATLPALTTRPDQVKPLRQTILNLAVRGKLVEQDPTDEPASELLNRITAEKAHLLKTKHILRQKPPSPDPDYAISTLPSGWKRIALGDVLNFVTSGSRGWSEYYADTGPFFIRAQNIRFGQLLLDNLAHVQPPSNSEGSRTQVSKGDILIVITGAGVTNPAILGRDIGEAYVSQHVGLARPTDPDTSSWLLLCLLSDCGGRAELVERAYGAGRPGLNLDNIRSLTIPLPPLAEQHRIVAKVVALMALCDRLKAALAAADTTRARLLEALLHEALDPSQDAMKAAE